MSGPFDDLPPAPDPGAFRLLVGSVRPIDDGARTGGWVLLLAPSGYLNTPARVELGRYEETSPLCPWRSFSHDGWTDSGPEPTHYAPVTFVGRIGS